MYDTIDRIVTGEATRFERVAFSMITKLTKFTDWVRTKIFKKESIKATLNTDTRNLAIEIGKTAAADYVSSKAEEIFEAAVPEGTMRRKVVDVSVAGVKYTVESVKSVALTAMYVIANPENGTALLAIRGKQGYDQLYEFSAEKGQAAKEVAKVAAEKVAEKYADAKETASSAGEEVAFLGEVAKDLAVAGASEVGSGVTYLAEGTVGLARGLASMAYTATEAAGSLVNAFGEFLNEAEGFDLDDDIVADTSKMSPEDIEKIKEEVQDQEHKDAVELLEALAEESPDGWDVAIESIAIMQMVEIGKEIKASGNQSEISNFLEEMPVEVVKGLTKERFKEFLDTFSSQELSYLNPEVLNQLESLHNEIVGVNHRHHDHSAEQAIEGIITAVNIRDQREAEEFDNMVDASDEIGSDVIEDNIEKLKSEDSITNIEKNISFISDEATRNRLRKLLQDKLNGFAEEALKRASEVDPQNDDRSGVDPVVDSEDYESDDDDDDEFYDAKEKQEAIPKVDESGMTPKQIKDAKKARDQEEREQKAAEDAQAAKEAAAEEARKAAAADKAAAEKAAAEPDHGSNSGGER